MLFERYDEMIFLHPMKTAGTSISSFIRKQVRKRINPEAKIHHYHHMTPDEIMWKFDFPEDWFQRNFVVMFVRNPYERLVSFYHHMRQIGGHAEGICKRKSFRTFIEDNKLTIIVRPLAEYMIYNDADIVTYLGRYESLDEDVNGLIDLIGFGDEADAVKAEWRSYEHKMITKHDPYENYYDIMTAGIVYDKYQSDFNIFGYEPMGAL